MTKREMIEETVDNIGGLLCPTCVSRMRECDLEVDYSVAPQLSISNAEERVLISCESCDFKFYLRIEEI
jgi:hypothetical protein